MNKQQPNGFTLIELMIAIMILGILAATAVPSFVGYLRSAKTNEAVANIGTIARGQVEYWITPHMDSAGARIPNEFITAPKLPAVPGMQRQTVNFMADPNWTAINFAITDPIYFSYETIWIPAAGVPPDEARCEATGDLNGNGVTSLFSLSVFGDNADTARKMSWVYSIREYE